MFKILSLDVSAACTGWSFTTDGKVFINGTIKTLPKNSRSDRLNTFYTELSVLLTKYTPNYIVIEDTFAGKNTKTLKILSEFAGVAKLCCMRTLGIEPYIISNSTVKAFFKAPTKEVLFYFVCDLVEKKDLNFKKNNDIIDAQAQLMCYAQDILKIYTFKLLKDYGFMYYMEDINEKNKA
jgi:Holliday junction resolvasome RuvABC endonuclease subunit